MHAAGIKKGKYTTEQAVIHKKGQSGIPVSYRRKEGQQKTEIHGKAAKLKWEIPPIIGTMIDQNGKAPLFPNLACGH